MSQQKHDYPAWVEIDLKALEHNFKEIKKAALRQFQKASPKETLPQLRRSLNILAVIKAQAYGHGMVEVAALLDRLGVDFLGVSDIAEGVCLRRSGLKKPILLFETTLAIGIQNIVIYNLTPTVCTMDFARALNDAAKRVNRRVDVHINVDTGMGRLGIWHKEAQDFITRMMKFSHLSVQGIYTHFPVADTDASFTKNQIKILYNLIKGLDRQGYRIPYIHASNSMGLGYNTRMFNMVRSGLALYGLYPAKGLQSKLSLKPVMSVKVRVIFVKTVDKGRGVSYGRTFIAKKKMTVATLPIGYSDGYLRIFSNKSHVLIKGRRCPVVGRVTMDQIMVDVSKLKDVKIGDEAVILGSQEKACISAQDLARLAKTINYEIVCKFGNRLPRIYQSSLRAG